MKAIRVLLLWLICSGALYAQTDSLYLHIIVPEADTTLYNYSRYRLAGNTLPEAKVFINGEEVKVYPSGAFVGMIEHISDTTRITFEAVSGEQKVTKQMFLIRPPKPDEIKPHSKTITNFMLNPSDDYWIGAGELLEVRFLGSSGEKAVFNIDGFKRNIPMKELPPELTGGLKGVYAGEYRVKPEDKIADEHITFKVKRNMFSYRKKKSPYTVSFNGLPRVAQVTADKGYLNVGLGTDRLGGAKYGYLEKGVKLKVVGRQNDNYKIELSKSLSAWIPEGLVELLPEGAPIPESLTGNITITGDAKEDIITLDLSQKLPYVSVQELNPNKIIVDVFGATSNTNWKTKHLSSKGIKEVEWRQVEDNRFRLLITLNNKQNWGYSVGYGWGSQLQIKVKRPPVVTQIDRPLFGMTIAVDAGHGGNNNGALGATGALEKNVTLQISQKIDSVLKARGAKTLLTRKDDGYVYMSERADMILKNHADLLVSIHANSIGYSSNPLVVKGTGAFYKHIAYKPLAEKLYSKMLELGLDQYGLTGSFNFYLNGPNEYPNALVETLFISNPEEEMLLLDPAFQAKIAEQIVKGLEEYFLENVEIKELEN